MEIRSKVIMLGREGVSARGVSAHGRKLEEQFPIFSAWNVH